MKFSGVGPDSNLHRNSLAMYRTCLGISQHRMTNPDYKKFPVSYISPVASVEAGLVL
jgi:hypothetical protein